MIALFMAQNFNPRSGLFIRDKQTFTAQPASIMAENGVIYEAPYFRNNASYAALFDTSELKNGESFIIYQSSGYSPVLPSQFTEPVRSHTMTMAQLSSNTMYIQYVFKWENELNILSHKITY